MSKQNTQKTDTDMNREDLVGHLLSDTLPNLVEWLRTKVECHRIDFEEDAPYLEGMLEDIEAVLAASKEKTN